MRFTTLTRKVISLLPRLLATLFFIATRRPTKFHTLSLHYALPISVGAAVRQPAGLRAAREGAGPREALLVVRPLDRKSTRLNSSHRCISYAVFCLKKKIHYV